MPRHVYIMPQTGMRFLPCFQLFTQDVSKEQAEGNEKTLAGKGLGAFWRRMGERKVHTLEEGMMMQTGTSMVQASSYQILA